MFGKLLEKKKNVITINTQYNMTYTIHLSRSQIDLKCEFDAKSQVFNIK